MLAGCGNGGGLSPLAPQAPAAASAHHAGKGKLVLRIHVPKKKRTRHGAHYISAATQAMTIAIVGLQDVNETVGLTPTATGCQSSLAGTFCTLEIANLPSCPSSSNCYSATLATYDAVTGCPSACAIPSGAQELSGNQDVNFTVAAGASNQIDITLDGIPASLAFLPAGSALSGNASTGFTVSKCLSSAVKVQVLGVDADGNFILGAGAPTVALTSNDTAHLAVATPPPSAPNTFAISRPNIPPAKTAVVLTASVTPLSGGGGSAVSSPVNVTFNSDICGVVTEFTAGITGSMLNRIAVGPDGNLWFTDRDGDQIGKVTTQGTITEYSVPTANSSPSGIAAGPDGNVWFTECNGTKIGKIGTNGSVITEYSTGITADSSPAGITAGPDGNLWFAELSNDRIARITTGGSVTEYAELPGDSLPANIVTGPGGNLWFTELVGADAIGQIGTSGVYGNEYASLSSTSSPQGIAYGPDGNVWFTEAAVAKIGRFNVATGTVSEFGGLTGVYPRPVGITSGPDGNVWFTECQSQTIAKITTSGTVTEYPGLLTGSPSYIVTGPDGNLWFTEFYAIGRMQ